MTAAAAAADPIDVPRLQDWMDGVGLGSGPVTGLDRLAGGTQNLLYRFRRSGRDYVLRRPPAVLRPTSARTIERETQVLAALADTDVPHPRLIAACADVAVLGAPFYLMEPVAGFNPTTTLPPLHAGDPSVRRAMGFALVDGAVALSRVDPFKPALAGFGDPDGYLGRQVARWRSALQGYEATPGWPGPAGLPGVVEIGDFLEANVPDSFRPGLIHGDYHFANVMFDNDGPGLAAIVDWELSTIGDPLLDMAWIVACWRGPPEDDVDLIRLSPADGFPGIAELVGYYAERTGRDLSAFPWYVALACWKLAIILEGTFVRSLAGHADADTGTWLHRGAQQLLRRGLRAIRA